MKWTISTAIAVLVGLYLSYELGQAINNIFPDVTIKNGTYLIFCMYNMAVTLITYAKSSTKIGE